jgi:hypothetical protein
VDEKDRSAIPYAKEIDSTNDENPRDRPAETETEIEAPLDIPTMIRGIQEITNKDDSSKAGGYSLPTRRSSPPPLDIRAMIEGIESVLRDATAEIPRTNGGDDGDDDYDDDSADNSNNALADPELKARNRWNTPLGWMPRKQRFLEVPSPSTNPGVVTAEEHPTDSTISEPKIIVPNY